MVESKDFRKGIIQLEWYTLSFYINHSIGKIIVYLIDLLHLFITHCYSTSQFSTSLKEKKKKKARKNECLNLKKKKNKVNRLKKKIDKIQ